MSRPAAVAGPDQARHRLDRRPGSPAARRKRWGSAVTAARIEIGAGGLAETSCGSSQIRRARTRQRAHFGGGKPQPKTTRKTVARSARTEAILGTIAAFMRGPVTRPLRQPVRSANLTPRLARAPAQKRRFQEGNAMLGLMQDWPLLIHRIIDHAAKFHGERKVITRSIEGPIVETNYAQIRARALKVAQRLERDGIKLGDRVATLAWNTAPASGSLVRHHGHRRDLPHGQSAAVPRADRVDRQPRRRPHADHRSHLRAAAGKDRRQAADHRALHRAHRRRAYAEDHAEERGRL